MMAKSFQLRLLACSLLSASCTAQSGPDSHHLGGDDEEPTAPYLTVVADLDAAVRGGGEVAWVDGAVDAAPAGPDGGAADAGAAAPSCDELTYANTGAPFVSKYCAVCHRLPQPTFNSTYEIDIMKVRMETRLLRMPNAPMPPPNAPLLPTLPERERFVAWLHCTPLD